MIRNIFCQNLFILVFFLNIVCVFKSNCSDNKKIGISLLTRNHQFFLSLEDGFKKEAAKQDVTLHIVSAEYNIRVQQAQIKDFLNKKMDAIIIIPCDSKAIGASIAEADKFKIPIFTVDIANISSLGSVVCHISSDNLDGGKKAAELMARAINDTGKIVIISHPNVTSVSDRVYGFRQEIKKFPAIEIVAEVPCWGLRDRAMSVMEDILLNMPEIKGVFAINDNSACGVLDAIKAAKLNLAIVSYDAIIPEVKQAIQEGKIYGAVVQYPEKIGVTTISIICDYFKGKKIPSKILVPVGVKLKEEKN